MASKISVPRKIKIPSINITTNAMTKPGIKAEKPRETPSGTASGIFITQLRFIHRR